MSRKLISFHDEDYRALQALAEDRASTLQELIDEAVRDLLRKYRRPTSLREALRGSAQPDSAAAGDMGNVVRLPRAKRGRRR